MFKRWINWLKGDAASDPVRPTQQRRRVSAHAALHARSAPSAKPRKEPDIRDMGPSLDGRIENAGPGKNVLVPNEYSDDDTGAREMLKLLDDTPLDPAEPTGIDPYNSGQFDRSRHWNTRFRN
jgi:hypothetical protein